MVQSDRRGHAHSAQRHRESVEKGSAGFTEHPDFGQCVDQDMFKTFKAGVPCVFVPEDQWYLPTRDRSWDVFLPALEGLNERHERLLTVVLLLLDESMSGWRHICICAEAAKKIVPQAAAMHVLKAGMCILFFFGTKRFNECRLAEHGVPRCPQAESLAHWWARQLFFRTTKTHAVRSAVQEREI